MRGQPVWFDTRGAPRFRRIRTRKGEEIMVLDGAFADEHGIYPAGTYIKNPPGSMRAPRSAAGCTLFVKLGQLDDRDLDRDLERVVVRPLDRQWRPGLVSGLDVLALDRFGATHTALVRWAPGTVFSKHRHFGGEVRISANVTADFGNVTDLELGAGLRG